MMVVKYLTKYSQEMKVLFKPYYLLPATKDVLQEKVFLKISQISQKNIYVEVSFW